MPSPEFSIFPLIQADIICNLDRKLPRAEWLRIAGGCVSVPQPEEEDDAALVAGVQSGDEAAGRALYARYQKRLWWLAWRLGGNEADDYYGEMLLQVLSALDLRNKSRWDEHKGCLDAFIMSVARNRGLQLMRQRRRRPVVQYPENRQFAAPDEGLDANLDVQRCFEQLDEICQKVLLLSEEHKPGAIAEILAKAEGWVYVRLHRCRAKMRNCLEAKSQTRKGEAP